MFVQQFQPVQVDRHSMLLLLLPVHRKGYWCSLCDYCFFVLSRLSKRNLLLLVPLLAMPATPVFAAGASDEYQVYEEQDKFSLTVPKDWIKGEGKVGSRRVVAFHPSKATFPNVNVIITNLGADFTGIGSLGSVDSFAASVVGSMDRSYKRPPGTAARLVNAVSRNGMYYLDYTVQTPGEAQRHFFSVAGVGETQFYKQLYTATGQYWEADGDRDRKALQEAIESFRIVHK
ncbi:psbP domain-containing protein 3, chloroplastic-like isoform X1 [Selaginella moellendorffii]|uniref:psbP domain-containing protein 3, chloroplastic-like isoform X1 n=1 Tax=Selaginella moellendorffii TaxID=88036 RepID=UPI000D1CF2F3|nr:psbP domain-containing protein 3, chloroplastic-like isoform X1 [Selaginella moellendorffii]|eukprot:XP_024516327.1 psbP domain-containing protein 3, chloroplastic-like isoform X1 [Selaginella moellendorffii]